ncbi:MAG: DUF2273 domain-containing protein [Clostridiales bacterium]
MDWLNILLQTWESHKGKIIGITLGLLFGIGVITYGFWPALFVFFCVFLGFFFGKKIDNRMSIKETVEKIFAGRDQ